MSELIGVQISVKELRKSYELSLQGLSKLYAVVPSKEFQALKHVVYTIGDLLASVNGHSDTPTTEVIEFTIPQEAIHVTTRG